MRILVSKNQFYLFAILVLAVFVLSAIFLFPGGKASESAGKEQLSEVGGAGAGQTGLQARFASLSEARSNYCAGPDFIDEMTEDDRIQGSCCSAMDFHRYEEQVEGLKKYAHIDKIPSDPYDVPVSLARELLGYQESIQLSAEQQAVYDEAVSISHEGGPCCCKCWRWYAFEGLAKYLITEHGFSAGQIAEVWDLEDGCGGSGHAEGTHA